MKKVLPAKRDIVLYPKHTSANTQYYDMDPDDEAFVYQWLMRFMADMCMEATWHPEIQKDWYKRKPTALPKSVNGPNSNASMIGGICAQKLENPNKNLSEPQLDAVESFFEIISQYYAEVENPPQAIRFVKKLFTLE
jgi:hypothetical protein